MFMVGLLNTRRLLGLRVRREVYLNHLFIYAYIFNYKGEYVGNQIYFWSQKAASTC